MARPGLSASPRNAATRKGFTAAKLPMAMFLLQLQRRADFALDHLPKTVLLHRRSMSAKGTFILAQEFLL
jgi:hypothetical protein